MIHIKVSSVTTTKISKKKNAEKSRNSRVEEQRGRQTLKIQLCRDFARWYIFDTWELDIAAFFIDTRCCGGASGADTEPPPSAPINNIADKKTN